MDGPRFSVVMPCHNAGPYIAEALQSALNQTHAAIEIIVVDDASTDDSRAIALSMAPAVRVLDSMRKGAGAARNLATAHAQGDWIAFLDADDAWLPDKLALQAELIAGNPDVDFVYSGLHHLYQDGTTRTIEAWPTADIARRLRYNCPILTSSVVARIECLRRERWNESLASSEDWDLFYRLSKHCKFGTVAEAAVYYRQHPQSLSSQDWRKVHENARIVSDMIQRDMHGLQGFARKRAVEAKLCANAAIAARRDDPREALACLIRSILAWPLPGLEQKRCRMLASMLLRKLSLGNAARRPTPRR